MQTIHILKVKNEYGGAYYIASIHKTEAGAIKERQSNIDRGAYKPEELEVITRFVYE